MHACENRSPQIAVRGLGVGRLSEVAARRPRAAVLGDTDGAGDVGGRRRLVTGHHNADAGMAAGRPRRSGMFSGAADPSRPTSPSSVRPSTERRKRRRPARRLRSATARTRRPSPAMLLAARAVTCRGRPLRAAPRFRPAGRPHASSTASGAPLTRTQTSSPAESPSSWSRNRRAPLRSSGSVSRSRSGHARRDRPGDQRHLGGIADGLPARRLLLWSLQLGVVAECDGLQEGAEPFFISGIHLALTGEETAVGRSRRR